MNNSWLRHFSKFTCFCTFILIFAGSLVTSTGSGLAVPDWPLSFGTLFPPMVGGILYEHSHRMIAGFVGILTLVLAVWLARVETRRWVKVLGFCALGAVTVQALLGGLTVLFFLPTPISVSHALLGQTFFILTIIIAYSQSKRPSQGGGFFKLALYLVAFIYIQLFLGALMRHTGSGLAIPDLPKMGGEWIPRFSEAMLRKINYWRFDMNLDPVTIGQVVIHFLHRIWAVVVTGGILFLTVKAIQKGVSKRILWTVFLMDVTLFFQLSLGIATVLTEKAPFITSFHVAVGAALLGLSVLLALQSYSLKQIHS